MERVQSKKKIKWKLIWIKCNRDVRWEKDQCLLSLTLLDEINLNDFQKGSKVDVRK